MEKTPTHAQRLDNAALKKLRHRSRFAAHMEGRVQFKPKWINDPDTGALYRLVVRDPGNHVYEESPIEDQNCYQLALRKPAQRALINTELPPLPAPYHIETFRYNTPYPIQLPAISFRQFCTILHTLSRYTHWSVTEENNPLKDAPFLVNVLFAGDKIIGLAAWNIEALHKKQAVVDSGFFLLHPDAQGKGLGKHLLAASNQRLLALDPEATLLIETSDGCESACHNAALEFYTRQGYYIKKRFPFTYDDYKNGFNERTPVNVPERFFRDPDTNEVLPRFQAARLERDLARVAEQLLSAKGRGR